MTNRERILQITDSDRNKRIEKIISCIHRNYTIQKARPSDMTFPTADEIVNIIIPAKVQKDKISIFAHHDVFRGSSGFNDNSSGVVTLLRLQDFLKDNVELVITDSEERGGQGCRYYLENSILPKEAINLDVVGLPGKIFYDTYASPNRLITNIMHSAEHYPNVPFNDSYILENFGIPTILMLTGKSRETLIKNIFDAQHGGKNDHKIEIISEEMMDNVFEVLLKTIG